MSASAILARLVPLALAGGLVVYLLALYSPAPRWLLAVCVGSLVLAHAVLTQRLLATPRDR